MWKVHTQSWTKPANIRCTWPRIYRPNIVGHRLSIGWYKWSCGGNCRCQVQVINQYRRIIDERIIIVSSICRSRVGKGGIYNFAILLFCFQLCLLMLINLLFFVSCRLSSVDNGCICRCNCLLLVVRCWLSSAGVWLLGVRCCLLICWCCLSLSFSIFVA